MIGSCDKSRLFGLCEFRIQDSVANLATLSLDLATFQTPLATWVTPLPVSALISERWLRLRGAAHSKYSRLQSGRRCGATLGAGRHVSLHPPPIPLVYMANLIGVDPSMCILCVRFCQIDLAILQKYYVLTLELYAYLIYNLFSNNGNFSQMKSLFTNKLLMSAPPGSFIHISLRIGRPRISTKLGFW